MTNFKIEFYAEGKHYLANVYKPEAVPTEFHIMYISPQPEEFETPFVFTANEQGGLSYSYPPNLVFGGIMAEVIFDYCKTHDISISS